MKFYLFTVFVMCFLIGVRAALPVEGMQQAKPDLNQGSNPGFTAKANCPPSNARLFMDFNDVRCLIEVGGSLWQNRQIGASSYEVPKGSGNFVIYSGGIWMGGLDVNGQLKLAAIKFRQGGTNDFWPGPLSQTVNSGNYDPSQPVGDDARRDFGAATIDPDVCIAYDQFYTIEKSEVVAFAQQFECNKDPECDEDFPLSNDAINRINNWPAHGDVSRGQDYYLAPFYDYPVDGGSGDGVYDPSQGDHPWYDDILGRDDIECGFDRRISLFGDKTNWWVFNDKGNIHTESGADPIGMEIRAQAFSFATNDEVNRMTFYNYEMINRSTQTLFGTHFTKYVDADVGFAFDDYVGCDVARGLGYAYNATNFDPGGNGAPGYGANPPAIGVDFFEGPYQDADNIDNVGPRLEEQPDGTFQLVVPSISEALSGKGIVYNGVGLGYSDGIVDNERFGMRRFTHYVNSANPNTGDPVAPTDYYNFMTGRWKDNSQIFFGGDGYQGNPGTTEIQTAYSFPGDSDPLNWGTGGIDPGFLWSETNTDGNGTANPIDEDKRFLQHAGPFTLEPGAINNLTVGVVYGRAFDGDAYSSVLAIKRNDTKAQALFDNCFRILDPPNAPVLEIIELENELVLLLDNPFGNNVNEQYEEEDKINIVDPLEGEPYDKFYRFEGYQIYQMADAESGVADLNDINKARLVAQCDIQNDVSRLINFEFNEVLGFSVPVEMVDGENRGIRHSFRIIEDAFASGDSRLVNHKKYYYIAVAYAYNEYKPYDPDDAELLDGQKMPYISSRLGADGRAIAPVIGIPHNSAPKNDGTALRIEYGSSPEITTLDGKGNGNRAVELTQATEDFIIQNNTIDTPTYKEGMGPINMKVIDPLNVKEGYYVLEFTDYDVMADTASWVINRYAQKGDPTPLETIFSDVSIDNDNEQLIPEWGISVQISQTDLPCPDQEDDNCPLRERLAQPILADINYADTSKQWLTGVQHSSGFTPLNWIRSGDYASGDEANEAAGVFNPACYDALSGVDPANTYTSLLGGTVAPAQLARISEVDGCGYTPLQRPAANFTFDNIARNRLPLVFHPSVDVVFTSDKSKWTRCAVIELNHVPSLSVNQGRPGVLRRSPSIDKEGRQPGMAGYNESEATLNGAQPTGMGWFPGYAIDVETGRRLNMAYCENSFLAGENGADMQWNPTHRLFNNINSPLLGGQHTIYVFGGTFDQSPMPAYDQGQFIYERLLDDQGQASPTGYREVYSNISWVMQPMLVEGQELLATDVRVRLRINKSYEDLNLTGISGGRPTYEWSMDDVSPLKNDREVLTSVLDLINVVPNPYYAYSKYETNRLDTRVKITNLPERCKVRIYNTSGKLIRAYDKDSPLTSIDWDLKNAENIPIASGVYLIHVEVPEVGETVVKFFGGMRQPDLENL